MKPETNPPAQAADTSSTADALRAVQVAMDRRDNGGDARATSDARPTSD
jgi:hypothetical protein